MNPVELQPHELMQRLVDFFEAEGIGYRVVGSIASMVYGEPRFTNDVDMVADLQVDHISRFCQHFAAPEYYLAEAAMRTAIERRSQFNVLHPPSGLKADIIIPPDTEFARSEARRIRRIRSEGEYDACFGSPEDIVLNKLIYFRLSGGVSEKHLRDIGGMMKVLQEKLDRGYIAEWASQLGVSTEWESVCKRADERHC